MTRCSKGKQALTGTRGPWSPSEMQFSIAQSMSERLAEQRGPSEWTAAGARGGSEIMKRQYYVHEWLTHSNSYPLASNSHKIRKVVDLDNGPYGVWVFLFHKKLLLLHYLFLKLSDSHCMGSVQYVCQRLQWLFLIFMSSAEWNKVQISFDRENWEICLMLTIWGKKKKDTAPS